MPKDIIVTEDVCYLEGRCFGITRLRLMLFEFQWGCYSTDLGRQEHVETIIDDLSTSQPCYLVLSIDRRMTLNCKSAASGSERGTIEIRYQESPGS